MAVTTTTLAIQYTGHGSAEIGYPLAFPILDPAHVQVGTRRIAPQILGPVGGFDVSSEFGITYSVFPATGPAPTVGQLVRKQGSDQEFEIGMAHDGGSVFEIGLRDGLTLGAKFGYGDVLEYYDRTPFTRLSPGEFTLRAGPGGVPAVFLPVALDPAADLIVWRHVPLTQPTVLPAAGPVPARANETAFDRLCMQLQQLNRRLVELERRADFDFIRAPGGQPDPTRHVPVWSGPGDRASTLAAMAGQPGVQRGDLTLWLSSAAGSNDWRRFGQWQKEYAVFHGGEPIANLAAHWIGSLSADTCVKKIFLHTGEDVAGPLNVSLSAGAVDLGNATIHGGRNGSFLCAAADVVIPAGTDLFVSVETSGYTGTHGLSVGLDCRYSA